jgi:hypothetical protein
VGPAVDHVWKENIIFNTQGAGDMPAGTYRNFDPGTVKDAEKKTYSDITAVKYHMLNPSDVGHLAAKPK